MARIIGTELWELGGDHPDFNNHLPVFCVEKLLGPLQNPWTFDSRQAALFSANPSFESQMEGLEWNVCAYAAARVLHSL